MPNPDSTPDVTVPKELIAKLIEAAPRELQKELQDALNRAALINRDDPIFGLVLFLELLGNYYTRMAQRVITSGRESDERNEKMIELLNERVRILQGLEKGMHEAAARLDTAGEYIVKEFPEDDMAKRIAARLEDEVKKLGLSELKEDLTTCKNTMSETAKQANNTSRTIQDTVSGIDAAAEKLSKLRLPRLLSWTTIIAMVVGAFLALGVIQLNKHGSLEKYAWVGPGENGPTIMIVNDTIEDAQGGGKVAWSDTNGYYTIKLKKW